MAKTIEQHTAEIIGGIAIQLAQALAERDHFEAELSAHAKEFARLQTELAAVKQQLESMSATTTTNGPTNTT